MIKKRFKWWLAWSSEKFESYLEDQAKLGWRAVSFSFGQTIITFEKDEPTQMRYCIDYQQKPSEEYYTIMKDDGWQLVDYRLNYLIWRKTYTGKRPDIFTDATSRIERNKRIMLLLIILAASQLPIMISNVSRLFFDHAPYFSFTMKLLTLFHMGVYGALLYGIFRFIMQNKDLRNEL